mgnify:CR=1 FL=1
MYESGSNLAVGERGQSMKAYEKSSVMKSMTYERVSYVSYAFLRLFIRGVGIGIIYSIIPIHTGTAKRGSYG